MNGTNWTCPFCDRPQTLTKGQVYETHQHLYLEHHRYGRAGITLTAVACANPNCGEITLSAQFGGDAIVNRGHGNSWELEEVLSHYSLRPDGAAKPQPDYIPKAIRDNYAEACRILRGSAMASATMSRRCLQGMVRDFCGISRGRLIDELIALDEAVATGTGPIGVLPDSVEAIDEVRGIGNIGAHMEKDVNVIIPVEPYEAEALIGLIELLFEEWYVAREVRKNKLELVKKIAAEKKLLKGTKPANDPQEGKTVS